MLRQSFHQTHLNATSAQIQLVTIAKANDRIFLSKDKRPALGPTVSWFAPIRATQIMYTWQTSC